MPIDTGDVTRRRFLSRITNGIMGIIGAILGVIGGGAMLSSTARKQDDWTPASSLLDLPDNQPTPVTLTVSRLDGFREVIQRKTIFLVKTHDAQVFRCPCHGGIYDRTGAVKDGPPPMPLSKIATRIDGERVLVQV